MPEGPKDGQFLDLRDYHQHQGRRYKTMQLAFSVLAMLVIARSSSDFAKWLAASGFALVAAACAIVALRTRRVWLDTAAAVVLLAMAPIFLWMNLKGLSA
jgi:branched-subunit amino acid transport protein AzlD